MKINLKTKPPLDPLPDTRARRMVLYMIAGQVDSQELWETPEVM